MQNIVFTDESVKRQITDLISENLNDSDCESNFKDTFTEKNIIKYSIFVFQRFYSLLMQFNCFIVFYC